MTIDLKRFCAKEEDPREYLRAPWRDGAWVYATNGHYLLRVAADTMPDAVPRDKHPDGGALFRKHLEDRTGLDFLVMPPLPKLKPCADCGGKGQVRAIKCADCVDGEFKHGNYTYTCQNCDESPAGAGWEHLNAWNETRSNEVLRDCISCDGLGHNIQEHRGMAVGEASYAVVYLAMLAKLPQVRICPGEPANTKDWSKQPIPAVFTFDGGHALLMPRRD